jgi:hypothetical protein
LFLHADTLLPKAAWNEGFWANLPEMPMKRVFSADAHENTHGKGVFGWGRFDVAFSAHPRQSSADNAEAFRTADDTHTTEALPAMMPVVARFMNARSRLTGIATGDQALFMTRAAFEAVGGFPDLPLMEDVEICARLRQFAAPVCLRERVTTSARRWQKRGVWRTITLMWWLRLAYWLGVPPETIARWYR